MDKGLDITTIDRRSGLEEPIMYATKDRNNNILDPVVPIYAPKPGLPDACSDDVYDVYYPKDLTEDVCAVGYTFERHVPWDPSNHGDVCRQNDGSGRFSCPFGCNETIGDPPPSPFCTDSTWLARCEVPFPIQNQD